MLYYKNEQWHFCKLKVTYDDRGQQKTKYTNDKQWWQNFVEKWWHTNNLKFEVVESTQKQLNRLDIVNNAGIPEGFMSEVIEYVQNGRILNPDNSWFDGIAEDPDLETFRQQKYAEIETEGISRTELMPWTIPGTGTQVQVKISEEPPHKPRMTWLSGTSTWGVAKVLQGNTTDTDNLIAADNTLHSMTASEWVDFGVALKEWVRDNLRAEKQHMSNVEALMDVQQIIDYDYSTGWPG